MPDLDEQIRELVNSVRPVTADEVIASSGSPQSRSLSDPSRSRRMETYALGAAAMGHRDLRARPGARIRTRCRVIGAGF